MYRIEAPLKRLVAGDMIRFSHHGTVVLLIASWIAQLGCARLFAASIDERPPNIVLILADDLGYGDLGCYGQRDD